MIRSTLGPEAGERRSAGVRLKSGSFDKYVNNWKNNNNEKQRQRAGSHPANNNNVTASSSSSSAAKLVGSLFSRGFRFGSTSAADSTGSCSAYEQTSENSSMSTLSDMVDGSTDHSESIIRSDSTTSRERSESFHSQRSDRSDHVISPSLHRDHSLNDLSKLPSNNVGYYSMSPEVKLDNTRWCMSLGRRRRHRQDDGSPRVHLGSSEENVSVIRDSPINQLNDWRSKLDSSTGERSSSSRDCEKFQSIFDESDLEEIQCLLPNGIILDIPVHPDDEICHIKQVVLNRATTDERLPLKGCLNPDGNHYTLTYVNTSGRLEECLDERRTLRDIKPFNNILKFGKKTKGKGHYLFRKNVGNLIGKSLTDFEDLRNCEVNEFQWRMKVFANDIAQERKQRLNNSLEERIKYQYPPKIVSHPNDGTKSHLLEVCLIWREHKKKKISGGATPKEVLESLGKDLCLDKRFAERHFIKIVGEDSFLIGDYRIIDFQYIRGKVQRCQIPNLIVVPVDEIHLDQPNESVYQSLEDDVVCSLSKDVYARNHSLTAMSLSCLGLNPTQNATRSFDVKEPFTVIVDALVLPQETYPITGFRFMGMQLGLFHGGRLLCPIRLCMFKRGPDKSGTVQIEEAFSFDITISNLPRMAKLCIGIFEKKRNTILPLFFVNTNVFDYRARLKWKETFHMWNYSADCMPTFQNLSPLRQTISNPDAKEAAKLIVSFRVDDFDDESIEYPNLRCFAKSELGTGTVGTIQKFFTQELRIIAERDPLHDLTVQEKDLIWKIREYCLTKLPSLLPRIVDCVDYVDQYQVAELAELLERWPLLRPEEALQLLDYAYPDENVRRYAVKCLRAASDDEIMRYLLQLAQALKHESYLHCDLVEFLLERALKNQHIGHYLFWELKAEMNSPSVGLLFGLILEAYLTAAPEHLKILTHQNTLLQKCRATHHSLQKIETLGRQHDKAKTKFSLSVYAQFEGNHPYERFVNPLNPGIRCQKINLDRCKLMNSKMRPQMLCFRNIDGTLTEVIKHIEVAADVEDVLLMYKKGDDLRQDRLTLQLLKVMDLLWKESGLDLRMNIYKCTSTDFSEGFIEVVQSAETICKIQMSQCDFKKPAAVFKKGLLLNWIKFHNSSEEKMLQAQYEFTQSCAGYSVATYILGIGDRHNDNIMVKTNGQMFHIDFGHFLGNFKHKFGIKRERVPMILSSEFIEVIKADFGRKKNFERFRDLCEKAFLTIRRHGSLIISLLAMMISTGLPELSSEQDLNIIRSTLHLDRNESDALDHFRKDFNDSLKNAWTISLDWWFHMMNQARSRGNGK